MPASDQPPTREPQALKWAWRCRRCGNAGVSVRRPGRCASDACAGTDTLLEAQPYIEPAGFAVEISDQASNDLTRNTYLPVEQPWITTGGESWQSLPRPELGRYRYSGRGHVFTYSRGNAEAGYAVCLRCGRAASERGPQPAELPDAMREHRPLRGGSDRNERGACRGNDSPWLVQRHTWLGASKETDVFELQLWDPDRGEPLARVSAASSLAIALRQALAERISVEEREIGWACVPARVAGTGQVARSIILFDTATGGAGFVERAVHHLPWLLARAKQILTCPRGCDSACHACLLTYDTHHHARELNRHHALEVLSDRFLAGMRLPDHAQVFGEDTALEFEPLGVALGRELRFADRLRLLLGGDPHAWELEEWQLRERIGRWASDGVSVEVLVPSGVLARLDSSSRSRLAAWADAGLASISEVPGDSVSVGGGWVIAEVGRADHHVRFAVLTDCALTPGALWGMGEGSAHVVLARLPQPLPPLGPVARTLAGDTLRVTPPGVAVALAVNGELDGPVSAFGERFWTLVLGACTDLRSRLSAGLPVRSITYGDRYLRTPLMLRLVSEVLRDLHWRFPHALAGARAQLVTIPITQK
ncbi:MAG TPA: DUF1998 domain-containing protein, partial [Longimicrobiaceae bacterium]|nr:DUF1998 domain-containing protein [Longimicrobiaceae bacterium]